MIDVLLDALMTVPVPAAPLGVSCVVAEGLLAPTADQLAPKIRLIREHLRQSEHLTNVSPATYVRVAHAAGRHWHLYAAWFPPAATIAEPVPVLGPVQRQLLHQLTDLIACVANILLVSGHSIDHLSRSARFGKEVATALDLLHHIAHSRPHGRLDSGDGVGFQALVPQLRMVFLVLAYLYEAYDVSDLEQIRDVLKRMMTKDLEVLVADHLLLAASGFCAYLAELLKAVLTLCHNYQEMYTVTGKDKQVVKYEGGEWYSTARKRGPPTGEASLSFGPKVLTLAIRYLAQTPQGPEGVHKQVSHLCSALMTFTQDDIAVAARAVALADFSRATATVALFIVESEDPLPLLGWTCHLVGALKKIDKAHPWLEEIGRQFVPGPTLVPEVYAALYLRLMASLSAELKNAVLETYYQLTADAPGGIDRFLECVGYGLLAGYLFGRGVRMPANPPMEGVFMEQETEPKIEEMLEYEKEKEARELMAKIDRMERLGVLKMVRGAAE